MSEEKTSAEEPELTLTVPPLYTQTWSQTVVDVVQNFCRTNDALPKGKIVPTVLFSLIGYYWTGDQTRNHPFNQYIFSIIAVQYIRRLQNAKKKLPKFQKSIESNLEKYLPKKKKRRKKFANPLHAITADYILKLSEAIISDEIVDLPIDLKWEMGKRMIVCIDKDSRSIIDSLSRPSNLSQNYNLLDETKTPNEDIKNFDFNFRILDAMESAHVTGELAPMLKMRDDFFYALGEWHAVVLGALPENVNTQIVYGVAYDAPSRVYIFQTRYFWIVIHFDVTAKADGTFDRGLLSRMEAQSFVELLRKPFDQLCYSMK